MMIPYFIVTIIILAFIIYPLTKKRGNKEPPKRKLEKELLIERIIIRVRKMSSSMINNVQLRRALFNYTNGGYTKEPFIIDDYDIVATIHHTHYSYPKTFLLRVWDEEVYCPRPLETLIKEVIECICKMAVDENDFEAITGLQRELTVSAKELNYISN